MAALTAFKVLIRTQSDFTISFHPCYDAYYVRRKLFAVNVPMDVGSEDSHGVSVRFTPWLVLRPHPVALYAGAQVR
jgi:hypothetical protein